ncbi:MAG TPA: TRAM domain-containing protein, partial [Desulfobacteria bacterium]|nr:TRAM domain-containing protein [Desulfobacteria bacterium]
GEEMVVQVIKDGKESGQGVAYLDDGTMIVVDGGKRYIGQSIGVLVTSVLQTAAGRMIFAKPKTIEKKSVEAHQPLNEVNLIG